MGSRRKLIIFSNAEQPANAYSPIEVREFGSVRDVSPEHLENASSPISVREFRSVRDVSLEHPQNAPLAIEIRVSGNFRTDDFPWGQRMSSVASLLYSTPSADEYTVLPTSTLIFVRPEHPENAYLPIKVKDFGSVRDVRPQQFLNTSSPIAVREFGSVSDVRPEQFSNAS